MKKIILLLFTLLAFSCSKSTEKQADALPQAPTQVLDNLLALQNVEGLVQKFGKENVIQDTSIVMSDDTLQGSILFPNSDQTVFVFYHKGQISDLSIQGNSSKWITKSGLFLGLPLSEVEKLNGKNFTISGFNWLHGGTVVSWEGGKLGGDKLSHVAQFSNVGNKHEGVSDEDYGKISGEAEFDVRHPAIQSLNPVLDHLSLVVPFVPEKEEGIKMGRTIEKSQIPPK
ncbi:hypothetical protein EOJ36_10255 [Sandaracinomonas limnophila]|uniref:Lipoprotein n=1 Tax=Sandaracinomonas limnophila TaxID=1862386 RepID=A0A437PMF6_9BACT|nr:hypothetical protein [Sandaracinomonas limnophila]RVU23455.1 hypothetical protein EOJ36_10255 [Sandaracinomonas limnophila]